MINYYYKYLKYKYKYLLLKCKCIKQYIFYFENTIWQRTIINDKVTDTLLINKDELDNYITYNKDNGIGYIIKKKLQKEIDKNNLFKFIFIKIIENPTIQNLKILYKY
jgi:hypothetical protein